MKMRTAAKRRFALRIIGVGMALSLTTPAMTQSEYEVITLTSSGGSAEFPVNNSGPAASRADRASLTAERSDLRHRLGEAYGRLPLTFEANRGQTDPRVEFVARGPGYTLFLTPTEAVMSLVRHGPAGPDPSVRPSRAVHPHGSSSRRESAVLRMTLMGANPQPRVAGRDELPGKVHYVIGNDPTKWQTKVSTFARVNYADVYPGVDLTFYGNQRQLEYDFIVGPDADPRRITLQFEGADAVGADATGELVLRTGGEAIRQHRPQIYQDIDGRRQPIAGGYVLRGPSRVGFDVAAYDSSRPLVIDPTLEYSTYLGGSGDDGSEGSIAVDATGSVYVTGSTNSPNFPTTPGAFDTTRSGPSDAFVTKLDADGSALVYSTYLGGSGDDIGGDIAVDAAGSAYVTGLTLSSDFPTTPGAFDTTNNDSSGDGDTFVTKLNAAGSVPLVYSTYLGGSRRDQSRGVVVDAAGSAYVTGFTNSPNFPTTSGAFDRTFNGGTADAFVTKLNAAGSALVYSTYLGGSGDGFDIPRGIAVDAAGSAYVIGETESPNFPTTPAAFDTTRNGPSDAFVTKLNAAGSALVYSTYLGTSGQDLGVGIAVDAAGSAYVVGDTNSPDFPTTPGAFDTTLNFIDAFVTKLNAAGSALVYSTYLGGSGDDRARGMAVDAAGSAYVTGLTFSSDFPITPGAFDATFNGGSVDVFVTKLNAAASALVYSTYLGGSGDDVGFGIAVDAAGSAYVTGYTSSANFPTTSGAFDPTFNGGRDAFVTKIADVGRPTTLTLTPAAASNPVETQHCVTATVRDAGGNLVADITVPFTVIGAVTTSGSGATDHTGQATFCYLGPPLPGADVISAYADTNHDETQDLAEPGDAATKTWTFPVTTPGCEISVTNGGWITAALGDRASFGGNARVRQGQTGGQQQYQDHGPGQPLNVHSINVRAIVCEGTTQASIFGQATVNGAGPFNYRIRVQDVGEPGAGQDTYWMLVQTGYNSGEQVLEGGNVQIRRQ